MVEKAPVETEFEIGHVLFIDLVGYSKRLIDEQRALLNKLNRIVRETEVVRTAEAAGKLTRIPTGDGMALVFRTSPEAPARCALEITKALREEPELQLRMGIHSGPVSDVTDVNERANVAGAGINMAQRVMDLGDAGHILLSRHVAEDLEHYARWQPYLHDLGLVEVKHGVRLGIVNLYSGEVGNPRVPKQLPSALNESARPRARRKLTATIVIIALFAAALFALLFTRAKHHNSTLGPAAAVSDKSIAVLPFVDLSQAHDQEYFCDGISEEILDALAKVEGLRVVARTSSFSFKGKNADVGEIAQKLNVQNVLEGSLRREGNRIRITAQLVNARDGFHLWSDTFERELQGVFAVQDEITRSIVDTLKVKLAVAPSARAPKNTEAYDLYLQGLYFSNKSDEESLRKSLSLFQQALDKDPNFARAWAGIAKAWYWLADAYVRPLEAYPKVKEAASRALALDERDADAHCYLGETKRVLDRNFSREEAELKRALEIDPNSATAHLLMSFLKSSQGELEEAVKEIQEAERLDPLAPGIWSFAVGTYLAVDRIEDAINAGKRTVQLDPNYVYFDSALADAYREKGDFREAVALYEKAQAATHFPSAGLAITYARMGRQPEAQRILNELVEKTRTQYVAAERIASVYVALGQKDEAFRWLERAFNEHSANLYTFAFHPEFRALRSDSRFPGLLRRIGIDFAKVLNRQKNP